MASLIPQGRQQYFDDNGDPLVGGFIWTYAANSLILKDTYTNAAESQTNTNPVELNARGEAVIFWSGSYKVKATTAAGVEIWTQDYVSDGFSGLQTQIDGKVAIVDLAASTGTVGATLVGIAGETASDALTRLTPYRGAGTAVDMLIVYGQSNAKGSAGTSAGDPTYKTPLGRVWNGSAFVTLTNYSVTSNDGTSTGGAWVAFANEYCQRTGRELVILNCAKASQSCAELQKGTGNYTAMAAYVTDAKAAIVTEGNTVGHVFVAYSQGERDSQLATTAAAYALSIAQLWTDMKADFLAEIFGIYTVGYYADSNMIHGQVIQQAQRLFARGNADVVILYDHLGGFGSHNLLKLDSVHYNQRGYNIMGREGATRMTEVLFSDTTAPSTDEHISRFGSLGMNQSQAWNLHAGMIQKSSAAPPAWLISHTSPRSHSLITSIDATTSTSTLSLSLACPARTIMCFKAEFGGSLKAANLRAVIGTGLTSTATWPTPTVDGVTVVPITFFADLHIRLNLTTQVMDNTIMGATLASLMGEVSVVWNSTGIATVTHPTATGWPNANIQGSLGRMIRVNGASTSTSVTVRDAAGAVIDDVVHLVLRNVAIRHTDMPATSELSFMMIAADYAVW